MCDEQHTPGSECSHSTIVKLHTYVSLSIDRAVYIQQNVREMEDMVSKWRVRAFSQFKR